MNNGVNNSELKIEPVEQPQTATPTSQVEPPKEQEQQDLGANVKIAPVQPMYDENDKVIAQPEPQPAPQPEAPRPTIVQPTPTPPGEPPQIQIKQKPEEVNEEVKEEPVVEKPKRRFSLTPLFLIIIVGLIIGMLYIYNDKESVIQQMSYQNMLTSTNDQEIELDKDSTIIQDLYNKVATTVKEDLANPNLDDEMKRYLAYRQINSNKIYESNCNLFDRNKMYYYTCDMKKDKPNAFKEETLQLELKKLFGENSKIENGNIQLGMQCIGGYEYIAERGEYVQGKCLENGSVTITANKNIIKATKMNDEITIQEETNYISEKKEQIPEILKDGIYVYKFKLDTNYNYVYISKEYKTKY